MSDTLNIFLSHKHEDAHVAAEVKKLLGGLAEDHKLTLFLSEEISPGDDWFDWIRQRLGDSNLLLLLFTDATRTWDWCLYEAGLFEDLRAPAEERRRVVCLTGSNQTPAPLAHLQAVPADARSVERFLRDLFLGTELTGFERPLSPWLGKADDTLVGAAREIAQLVSRRPVRKRYFGKFLFIRVDDPGALDGRALPADARVESSAESLSDLFDVVDEEWTWGALEGEARKNRDTRWLEELCEAVHRFVKGRPPRYIQATFTGRGDGRTYRPFLYRIDTLAEGSVEFKLLFHEDVAWHLADVPPEVATLVTSLGMATRFRYEAIDKHVGRLGTLGDEPRREALRAIAYTFASIEEEARSRGLFERDVLLSAFDDPAERQRVSEMYDIWFEVQATMDEALQQGDAAGVEAQLVRLQPLNRRYLDMASRRYAEMMAAEGVSPEAR